MPQDAVQSVFRASVYLPEVQTCGNARIPAKERVRDILWIRIHLVERNLIGNGLERREIRGGGETVEHWNGRGIELIHRREAEDLLDSAEEACRVVLSADYSTSPGVWADAIGSGAIAAHMVESVLRIVLDPKDDRFFPKSTVTEGYADVRLFHLHSGFHAI